MAGERRRWRGWLVTVLLLIWGSLATRRFFGRRAESDRGLPAFKLTRRGALVHKLTHDAEVIRAAEASANGVPINVQMDRVEGYAREISPSFNASLYFGVGMPLAAWISNSLYDVRVDQELDLSALGADASVIFVMNHRSNLDYVLLAQLLAGRTAISFAAGEWANVWLLGLLFRGMGAYFVRRGSGDDLYRRVLERFVQTAVEDGLTQAIFPEGGLSRDGRPREPKLGLLDYTLRRFDPEAGDILFVPVGVNYDWVIEDHSLLQPGGPEAGVGGYGGFFASSLGSAIRNLYRARRGGSFRLGAAAVGVGTPVSAREYEYARGISFSELRREDRIEEVGKLARLLMGAIDEAIPPTAVPLVARAMLGSPEESVSQATLISHAQSLAPGQQLDYEAALRTLALRGLVLSERGWYRPAPGGEKLLAYYANSATG